MKRFSFILMALAMVMGMTQCKKDNTTANTDPVYDGPTTEITLTLNTGSNNRADVIPDDANGVAPVNFKVGDSIEVAYQGAWVGRLTCQELSTSTDQNDAPLGVFRGIINHDAPETGSHPLDFYFLGNKAPTIDNSTGYGVMTVDLSDQSKALPVISYASSEQNFQSGTTDYTVEYNWLMNQCALVKFDAENIYDMSANTNDNNSDAIYKTTQAITIYGMDNQVSIALNSKEFTWSQKANSNGAITLYRFSSDTEGAYRHAIVKPGTYNVTEGELEVAFDAANDPCGFFGTYKLQGEIAKNDYFMSTSNTTGAKDEVVKQAKLDLVWHSGAFSIASGQQVVFSRGNLQYAHLASGSRTAQTWRFAKHQYDFAGGVDDNNVQQGNVVLLETTTDLGNARSDNEKIGDGEYYGWIDLFGYGTGNNPTLHTDNNLDYNDWHEYGLNKITNSGKPENTSWWSTLTHNEWAYLATRNSESKAGLTTITGVTYGNLTNVPGLVLLPDVFVNPYSWKGLNASGSHDFSDNTYTLAQWKEMEKAGAVFLPASGWRNGTNWRATLDSGTALEHGSYYSSTMSTSSAVYCLRFGMDYHTLDHLNVNYVMAPDNGHSVRLVHRLN